MGSCLGRIEGGLSQRYSLLLLLRIAPIGADAYPGQQGMKGTDCGLSRKHTCIHLDSANVVEGKKARNVFGVTEQLVT